MNFLWIYILACCCNKNNAGTCREHKGHDMCKHDGCKHDMHKKHGKSCQMPQNNCSCQERPMPCQSEPVRDCQTPPPSGCQMPQNQGNHCQDVQTQQEMFQNQGRFCQHPF